MTMKRQRDSKTGSYMIAAVLTVIVTFAVTAASVITALTPKRYSLVQGDVAQSAIAAPKTFVDQAMTRELIEAAKNSVQPVYVVDKDLVDRYQKEAANFFSKLKEIRSSALELKGESEGSYQEILTNDQVVMLCQMAPKALTGEQLFAVLEASESELLRLSELILPKINIALSNGLAQKDVVTIASACKQELAATTLGDGLKNVGEMVIDAYVQATFAVDEEATNRLRQQAADAVEPYEIKQGQVIVEQGATVSASQIELLKELDLIRDAKSDVVFASGVLLYLAIAFAIFFVYLLFYQKEIIESPKKMVIMGVVISITMVLALLCSTINTRITPGLFAVMLTALLVSEQAAFAVNGIMAFCIGLMAGGRGSGLLQLDTVMMATSMLFAGFVAVVVLRQAHKRSTFIAAGLAGGTAGALGIFAQCVMLSKPVLWTVESIGWSMGSNAIVGILCAGTLSIWEGVFDVATTARLNELSNVNHPLLKQLMSEAPGTYHHSMMVAAMAEAAAQRVGANAALARVGAYFHDVGKLRRPLYFIENQQGENIHDTLLPAESAAIIMAHQKDSAALLTKHRLPSAIVRIALEHHGTTLLSYFYHRATEQNKNSSKPVSEKSYRYPGPKPSSLESAIVMLADSCEAAVRSLPKDANREQAEEIIRRVVNTKVEDGQLSKVSITLMELDEIQKSFLRAFSGMRHERIGYPDTNKGNKDG